MRKLNIQRKCHIKCDGGDSWLYHEKSKAVEAISPIKKKIIRIWHVI